MESISENEEISSSDHSSLDSQDFIPENFNFIQNQHLRNYYDFCTKVYNRNSNTPIFYAYNSDILDQYILDQHENEEIVLSVNDLMRERQTQNDLLNVQDFSIYYDELDQNPEEVEDFCENPHNRQILEAQIRQYTQQYLQNLGENHFQTKLQQYIKQFRLPVVQQIRPLEKQTKTISKNRTYNKYTDHQINLVREKIGQGIPFKTIANTTQVKLSTVKKISARLNNGLEPRQPKPNLNQYDQIPEEFRQQIIQRCLEPQFRTYSIRQRREYFNNTLGLNNTDLQYKSLLESAGFSYRKGINCNQQIWENQAHEFKMKQVSIRIFDYLQKGYDIISIDETGLNSSTLKMYGWFPQGTGTIQFPRQVSFYNKSFCVAISYKHGLIAAQMKNKGYNQTYFRYFITKTIQKYRQISNYDTNFVFLMDNASIHKTKRVIQQLNEENVNVIFNATYTPRLNPIEEFFGAFKMKLKTFFETNEDQICQDSYEAAIEITNETIRKCFLNSFTFALYQLFENNQ